MKVRDGMSTLVLTIGPAHTLREAARLMSSRRVGAAVVIDPEHSGVGILTERDILDSLAAGQDPTSSWPPRTGRSTSCTRPPTGRCSKLPRPWSGRDSVTSWWSRATK